MLVVDTAAERFDLRDQRRLVGVLVGDDEMESSCSFVVVGTCGDQLGVDAECRMVRTRPSRLGDRCQLCRTLGCDAHDVGVVRQVADDLALLRCDVVAARGRRRVVKLHDPQGWIRRAPIRPVVIRAIRAHQHGRNRNGVAQRVEARVAQPQHRRGAYRRASWRRASWRVEGRLGLCRQRQAENAT